jgi:hypothetical protein
MVPYIKKCQLGVSEKGFMTIVFMGNDGKWYSCFPSRPDDMEGSSSGRPCETKDDALAQGAEAVDSFPFPELLIPVSIQPQPNAT